MDEHRIKSMEFCQAIINRMASNSFKLKSWFLVSFTALFTFFVNSFSSTTSVYEIVPVDLAWMLPLLMFPYLDSYYLKQERIFRRVYEDFANKSGRKSFDLRPTKKQLKEYSVLNVVFSVSVGWFYFPLLIAFQSVIIYHSENNSKGILLSCVFPTIVLIALMMFIKKPPTKKG